MRFIVRNSRVSWISAKASTDNNHPLTLTLFNQIDRVFLNERQLNFPLWHYLRFLRPLFPARGVLSAP